MIININQDEYITTGNDAAGARIVIHDQNSMPYPEDKGVIAKTGMMTSVHLTKVCLTRVCFVRPANVT